MNSKVSLRERPIVPALLATPGIALSLFYLYEFVYLLLFPPVPVGSEGPLIFFVLVLLIPYSIALGAGTLLPIVFVIFLLNQPSQHRKWGFALTMWWGLESIYLGIGFVYSLSTASGLGYGASVQDSLSWWTAGYAAPLIGLVGGIWAVVWHTGSTKMELVRRIVGPAGRVLIGGLVIFFSIGALPYFWVFFVPSIGLLFCGIFLFIAPRRSRVLGAVVLVACVFVGILLPSRIQDLGGYPINAYYSFGTAIAALVAGVVVAGSGALAVLHGGGSAKKQQNEVQAHM